MFTRAIKGSLRGTYRLVSIAVDVYRTLTYLTSCLAMNPKNVTIISYRIATQVK